MYVSHVGGVLMTEINTFIKENSDSSFVSSSTLGHSTKTAADEPGVSFHHKECAGSLILNFSVSRTVRNEFPYKTLSVWYFVIAG
jgi:hypothetical protein